jgi:hypothetical protein
MQVLLPHTLEMMPTIATYHMRAANNGSLGATRACRAAAHRCVSVASAACIVSSSSLSLCCCCLLVWPVVVAVVVVFLGVARSLPAVADLRVLTVEYVLLLLQP